METHGLSLKKRLCWFFEGPGSPAKEFGLIWWAVENQEVLDDQHCAKDERRDWRRGRLGLEKTGSY